MKTKFPAITEMPFIYWVFSTFHLHIPFFLFFYMNVQEKLPIAVLTTHQPKQKLF